jgi:hypothetical protein
VPRSRAPSKGAAADPHAAGLGVDLHAAEIRREVDHESAVDARVAGDAVAAAAHCQLEPRSPRVFDRPRDLDRAGRPGDQRGTAIDQAVPESPSIVIAGISGQDDIGNAGWERGCMHSALLSSKLQLGGIITSNSELCQEPS